MKQVRLKAWKNSPRNYLTTKLPVKADGSKVVYIIAFIRGIVLYRQHIGKRITNLLHREVYYVKPTGKLFYDPFIFPRNYWPKQIFEEYTIFFSVHNLTLSNISNGDYLCAQANVKPENRRKQLAFNRACSTKAFQNGKTAHWKICCYF